MITRCASRVFLPVILAAAVVACGRNVPEVVPGVSLALARWRAAAISAVSYRLSFAVPAAADADIGGHVVIAFDLGDASAPLQIDFAGRPNALHRVRTNGADSAYRFASEHIVIPAAELVRGHNEIEIDFVAGDAALNRNPDYLYTLFVPDRARTTFPVFDQPDLKATFELTLTLPAEWRALSSAPEDTVEDRGATRIHHFRRSDLMSSYLFSFAAGRFEAVTRDRGGRTMTMLHRETEAAKVERNVEAIFDLHAAAVEWLEAYAGIAFPFQKLDFALIPTFQYGGMEHVGAILYRASSLLLDEAPTDIELLGRASVIAHETAHMWFGDLVTMPWFDDVWMKEVFANFMAAKAVNPSFPGIDHDLSFLVEHYPPAYAVDRTAGANAIRQTLPNLAVAGQLYGDIIYDKAPIMMRQLEALVGEDRFRDGVREYLTRFAYANAGWPALIEILDGKTDRDLRAWSHVWVETPGRPRIELDSAPAADGAREYTLVQRDSAGLGRVWPQTFELMVAGAGAARRYTIASETAATPLDGIAIGADDTVVFNADGRGYGVFPADIGALSVWDRLAELERAALLVNLYEGLLDGLAPDPAAGAAARIGAYFSALEAIVRRENNQLVLDIALGQLESLYWRLLSENVRRTAASGLEDMLWQTLNESPAGAARKIRFKALAAIATSASMLATIHDVWSRRLVVDGLPLSEEDDIDLARTLAIKMPERAAEIVANQLARTVNPDRRRELEFIAPSLSADEAVRDAFFASLADPRTRAVEPWVLDALDDLHHPLRTLQAEKYILPSLELLEEIRVTSDIFFPERWVRATLANHRSPGAARTVREFLASRPGYDAQLRMKILVAADPLFRASALVAAEDGNQSAADTAISDKR